MIDWVWHIRGSVPLAGPESSALDRIENLLSAQYKSKRERGDDYVKFNDPLWQNMLSPNWLAMVLYDRGRFWVDRTLNGPTLRYELRSLHGFVFCLFGAIMFFSVGMLDGGIPNGLKIGTFAFCWVYGMNLFLAYFRVPRAVRKAVKG